MPPRLTSATRRSLARSRRPGWLPDSTGLALAGALALASMLALLILPPLRAQAATPPKPPPQVLLVGEFHGKKGTYTSIQQAVDAAHEGDWILLGPGDYKESSARSIPGVPTATTAHPPTC
jgi:hypothetical protein